MGSHHIKPQSFVKIITFMVPSSCFPTRYLLDLDFISGSIEVITREDTTASECILARTFSLYNRILDFSPEINIGIW